MHKTVVGRLPRQVEGPIFLERCGALGAIAMAADSAFIRHRGIQKIMRDVFVAPWMAVHTEGATS